MKMRWHWGAAIAVTYAVFAAGTVGFVAFAIGRPDSLVSPEYYSRALAQDRRIAAVANAQALGSALDSRVADDGAMLVLQLPRAQSVTARGDVTLYRPSDETADRTMPLALDREGTQRLTLGGLAPGRWRLQVEWVVDGRPFYYERLLDVERPVTPP